MPVQGGRHPNFQTGVILSHAPNQRREIPFHMKSQREEVGEDHQAGNSDGRQLSGGSRQIGLAQLKERCADMIASRGRH
jgi:hypothetical protein